MVDGKKNKCRGRPVGNKKKTDTVNANKENDEESCAKRPKVSDESKKPKRKGRPVGSKNKKDTNKTPKSKAKSKKTKTSGTIICVDNSLEDSPAIPKSVPLATSSSDNAHSSPDNDQPASVSHQVEGLLPLQDNVTSQLATDSSQLSRSLLSGARDSSYSKDGSNSVLPAATDDLHMLGDSDDDLTDESIPPLPPPLQSGVSLAYESIPPLPPPLQSEGSLSQPNSLQHVPLRQRIDTLEETQKGMIESLVAAKEAVDSLKNLLLETTALMCHSQLLPTQLPQSKNTRPQPPLFQLAQSHENIQTTPFATTVTT